MVRKHVSWFLSFSKYVEHKVTWISRSSRPEVFCKTDVLKKFTGKHLCQSPFFTKVASWGQTLLEKRLCHRCFPVNFCEISKKTFSYRTPPVTASRFDRAQCYWDHESLLNRVPCVPYVPAWFTCQRALVLTCQKRANFSFLRTNVPINVPKACQFFS